MKHYIELTLIDDSEIRIYELWSKLYTQLHLALVEIKDQNNQVNVGISFPEYRFSAEKCIGFLGSKVRLFATSEENLKNLNIKKWLERLVEYVHISAIRPVPQSKITGYASFRRKQFKTNADRLARYRVKGGDISFEEARMRYLNVITTTELPFIQLKSLNSSQNFKLFIDRQMGEKTQKYLFSTYGLSSSSTVPEF